MKQNKHILIVKPNLKDVFLKSVSIFENFYLIIYLPNNADFTE